MSKYTGLRAILLARFAKNCPWTVPFYEDAKTEIQMKRMGYKRMEDNKWEEQTRYIERQSGILATYAALTTHTLSAKAATPSPYPLSFAWRWAARSLNHPAGGEIEAAMMATFLEVTNQVLVKEYGRQAYKLLSVAVGREWVALVGKGPARGRLEVMADEFSRTGKVGEEGFGAFVP
jgi:nucleoporin GLE1